MVASKREKSRLQKQKQTNIRRRLTLRVCFSLIGLFLEEDERQTQTLQRAFAPLQDYWRATSICNQDDIETLNDLLEPCMPSLTVAIMHFQRVYVPLTDSSTWDKLTQLLNAMCVYKRDQIVTFFHDFNRSLFNYYDFTVHQQRLACITQLEKLYLLMTMVYPRCAVKNPDLCHDIYVEACKRQQNYFYFCQKKVNAMNLFLS